MKVAVYPGSFDPITLGHIDIIKRGVNLFDKIIVLVMVNPKKQGLFSIFERKNLIEKSLNEFNILNCEVDVYQGLLVDYLKKNNIKYIIKGIRAISDFEYEFQQYIVNSSFENDIETVFFMTNYNYMYLSSSLVKEIAYFKGDISKFVPSSIIQDINNKINNLRELKLI
ncbi:MAG: pantetheine-phosphate adenylyltransferase [bacterium]